jgi:6-pyruvoyltetrahydropterin/6-carboxytetrahydropterin synthase
MSRCDLFLKQEFDRMYSLTVSDHIMIAHSFKGVIFGPAQQLHGATYTVEVTVRRAELDADGLVCDIGLALQTLKSVLGEFNYKNLDDLPALRGKNTTTELLAGEIFRRMKSRILAGGMGLGTADTLSAMRVRLRESPVAWADYEAALG